MFLGEDLLAWLVLAFGGAMAVGNVLALIRPPKSRQQSGEMSSPPLVRTLSFAAVGGIAALWALGSLIGG